MMSSNVLIAVVDDEESVRNAFARVLRSSGFNVETFSSGLEFIDAANTRTINCVVLDVDMPGMSGFDVLDSLAKTAQNIPVVLVTGHDVTVSRMKTIHTAFYLRKPVDSHVLVEAIIFVLTMNE